MYVKQDLQARLEDIPFHESIYDENHPLIRLSNAIHWDKLLSYLNGFYSKNKGRPSIPMRAQAGTLIIKHLKNLSDRDTVKMVKENIYAQYFCGLMPAQVKNYMNPATGLTSFRAKIGSSGMAFIMEILSSAASGKSLKKGNDLILDTTCVPLDILYPTDIRLLEHCRNEIMRLFKKSKEFGINITYRTYKNIARRLFIRFSKLRKTTEKTRKRAHKKMFQFVKRNLKQLVDLRAKATQLLGREYNVNIDISIFLKNLKEIENKIRIIMHQQSLLRRGEKHIPNRIVSLHKDHVRPIVRGKVPVSTEFGPKILVAITGHGAHLVSSHQNNVNDTMLIAPALRWFKQKFGRMPKKISGDRGFYARWRVNFLEKMGILPYLQQRGKNTETSKTFRKMIRRHLSVEAVISLGKRKFGLNKCRARNNTHESSWIGLGISALNAHRSFFVDTPP